MKFFSCGLLHIAALALPLFVSTIQSYADDIAVQSLVVATNSTIDLLVPDLPDDLTYEWLKDGAPLMDSERVQGSATPHLVITAATLPDTGIYILTSWSTNTEVGTNAIYDV